MFLKRFSRHEKLPWCVPNLYKDADIAAEQLLFDNNCASVLTGLSSQPGALMHWRLTPAEAHELLDFVESKSGSSLPWWMRADGKLSYQELLGFLQNEENRKKIRELPAAVHGILMQELVMEAFSEFDDDGSGTLEKSEWVRFINKLNQLYMQYLLSVALLGFRAFFGRGQPWDGSSDSSWGGAGSEPVLLDVARGLAWTAGTPSTVMKEDTDSSLEPLQSNPAEPRSLPTLQCGIDADCRRYSGRWLIPPGWWKDLIYYSANNHPLHGMISCDPSGRLSAIERGMIELATCGLCLVNQNLKLAWVEHRRHTLIEGTTPPLALRQPLIFSILVVTIPGILIWYALYFLFTMPKCGMVNEALASRQELERAKRFTCCGETFGHILVLVSIVFITWRVVTNPHGVWANLLAVLFSRLQGWAFAWLFMLFITFNPIMAWGQPDPSGPFCAGDLLGLGQWRVEKQKFQVSCLRALKSRSDSGHGHSIRQILYGVSDQPLWSSRALAAFVVPERRSGGTTPRRESCRSCEAEFCGITPRTKVSSTELHPIRPGA